MWVQQLQAMWISSSTRKESFKELTIPLPDPNQSSKKWTKVFQCMALTVNIILTILFCWRYSASFHIRTNYSDPALSSENTNGIDFLLCFPDIQKVWLQWPVFILVESLAVLDLLSSLLYLKTLIESCLGSSCCRFFSYSKYSPTYSLLVAFQCIWLQQVALGCANSSSLGNLFNLSSVLAAFQSLMVILCGASCILLKMAESGICGYIDKYYEEELKLVLKIGSPVLQILHFIMSLLIWLENVKDKTLNPSWTKWILIFLFQLWVSVRVIEYIVNVFAYEPEERREDLEDQRRNFKTLIEMKEIGRRDQQREGNLYSISEEMSQLEDFRRSTNAERSFENPNNDCSHHKNSRLRRLEN